MQGPYNCYPLPPSRVGGDTEREVKGEDCQGVGGRVGGGKVKGQLSLRPVGTTVVRERLNKAPAVQSGHALPVGRRASPPWCLEQKSGRCKLRRVLDHYFNDRLGVSRLRNRTCTKVVLYSTGI